MSYALFGWHFKLVIEPQIVIAVVVFVIVVLIVTRRTAVEQLQVHLAFCAFQARARMHFRRIKVNLATLQVAWHGRNTCSADPPVQPASPTQSSSACSGIDYLNSISDLNLLRQQFALQNCIK